VLWFRGDLGVTQDGGGKVQTWADQSGNGYDVTQATSSKRPAFTSSLAAFGNRPSLDFTTAAVSALANTTQNPLAQSAARTIFAVVRPTDTVGFSVLDFRVVGGNDFAFQYFQAGDGNT